MRYLIGFCMFIFAWTAARADIIYVSGNVSGTWSADTVMVTGEITVPTGQALRILPGVQVRFTGLYKFIVQGRLTARGTPLDSILLTRAYPTEESKWRGLRLDGASDSSTLEYCHVDYAKGEGAYPEVHGGAIWINNCSPAIRRCLIANSYSHNSNINGMGGGICLDENTYSLIEYNHIILNIADSGGGLSVGWGSNATIRYNLIESNQANSAGGGIYISADAQASIYGNVIQNNTSGGWGGGGINLWSATWLYGTFSLVYDNLIANNQAADAGGGIYSRYDASVIYCNTLANNLAGRGGGIYVLTWATLPPTLHSSIVRDNMAPTGSQIFLDPVSGSAISASYCNILGGWPGVGIFDQDPAFVNSNQNDFRLQWGSPCVDTGDPGSQYNNPDGTRADMGAFYYDQSVPVRVLLTPLNAPLQIPAGGGSFDFIIQAANSDNIAHTAIIWCEAILPGGATYDPVMGPASLNLPAGATLGRQRTQAVPGGAPMGPYLYAAWAVVGSDSSTDSFPFVKIGVGNAVNSDVSWDNFGEALSFDILTPLVDSLLPTSALLWNSPNPFNATTTIRFTLAQAGQVALTIYDLQGKVVAIPVSGRREAGNQSFTFNGSTLSSGVYIYRLETPDYSISKKMALVK